MTETTKPLVEEFAPRHLSDVYGHVDITKTLSAMVDQGTIRNMIFYGEEPGTGKTATAQCIGRELYGDDYINCVYNFNASLKSSVEFIRTELSEIMSYEVPSGYDFIFIIIDEADWTSPSYQAALRRFIEDNEDRARFCIICNYLNKIIPPIQSRCRPLFFAPLFERDIVSRLQYICEEKDIKYEDGVLQKIAEYSGGSMRNAINDLDFLRFKRRQIKVEDVEKSELAINKIIEAYELAKTGKFISARTKILETMKTMGVSLTNIVYRFMDISLRDKKISAPVKARFMDEIARTHFEMISAPSQMIQVQGLLARIAYIAKKEAKQ